MEENQNNDQPKKESRLQKPITFEDFMKSWEIIKHEPYDLRSRSIINYPIPSVSWQDGFGEKKEYQISHRKIYSEPIVVERVYVGDAKIKVIHSRAPLNREQINSLNRIYPYI